MYQTRVNKDRRFGSAQRYTWVHHKGHWLAFTPNEVQVALHRAQTNPEDVPRLSLLAWIRSLVLGQPVRQRVS